MLHKYEIRRLVLDHYLENEFRDDKKSLGRTKLYHYEVNLLERTFPK